MYFLGIDSGTQSTKAILVELSSGKVVAEARASYDLISGLPSGHMEQNPEDWTVAVEEVVAGCLKKLNREQRAEVRGIGVSGQQHGLVVLDENDAVVRPAKLWCDTSTVEQCGQFHDAFGGVAGMVELAGNPMLPGYTAPKLLWLKQNEPENFARVRTVLLPHDYLNFHLTGNKVMEYGDASGTGLMHIRSREWVEELCSFIDPKVADMLPALQSSRKPAGMLKSELVEKWGLSGEVVVSAGGGDNMMGAIGTGNTKPGVVTVSLGTSGTIYGVSDSPVVDVKGEVAGFCDSNDKWLPLVCTMNVTVATERMRTLFGWDLDDMEAAVNAVDPGSDGLLFLPYFQGERTPNLPGARPVLLGGTSQNWRAEVMMRAAMEGATLGLAYGLRRFRELGMEPKEIRLTGGGSNSPAWRQICADAFGAEVVALKNSEGAAMGAAMQAAATFLAEGGAGEEGYAHLETLFVELDEATRCQPDAENTGIYDALLDRYLERSYQLEEAKAW